MTNKLTPQSSLEGLRKEAKRWLKALQTGETQAQERFSRNHPDHKNPSLRTVQHALAVEYGFSSWAALKRELEERALALRSHSERLTLFLEKSANRYHVAPGTAKWNTYERDTPARIPHAGYSPSSRARINRWREGWKRRSKDCLHPTSEN